MKGEFVKLAQLLSIFSQLKWGEYSLNEVVSICRDSRLVVPGSVYVAIRGQQLDGHKFIAEACQAGAIGLILESESNLPSNYRGAVVLVNNTRVALNKLAGRYYGNPAENLFCVGVTGTNGKTTTAYLTEAVLNQFGWLTGVMGTVDHHIGEHVWSSQMTTPDAIDLQKRLKDFSLLGAKAVAFEVSSHALSQYRADSIPFDCAVFTNLTRDHLDYHQTMEEYFCSKQRLFSDVLSRSSKTHTFAIVNGDDPYGERLQVADRATLWTYGQNRAEFSFEIFRSDFTGSYFGIKHPSGRSELQIPLVGEHNVYNATAAFAVGIAAGGSAETCCEALEKIQGVPGRMQRVGGLKRDLNVFVDYAHTDAALKSVIESLIAIRHSTKSSARIITVFGCGGDRDKGKRPLMAKAAILNSDLVIVTSDNPRNEDPEEIISEIVRDIPSALREEKVIEVVDRREAIMKAISCAKRGDVVLIAGKGHESDQIINGERKAFSDVEIAGEFLK